MDNPPDGPPGIPSVPLPAVPDLPSHQGRTWWMAALPAVGSLGAVGFLALAPRSPFIYVAGALIVLVSIGMVAATLVRARRERREGRAEIRTRFLADVDRARAEIRARNMRARRAEARATLAYAGLCVPVATDAITSLSPPVDAGPRADPFCRQRIEQLAQRTAVITDVPIRHSLASRTTIAGPTTQATGLMRQIVRRIVLDLDPDALRIAVLTAKPHRWRALRWAPQHQHPMLRDASGPARLVDGDAVRLIALLEDVRLPVLLVADPDTPIPDELAERARWIVTTGADDSDLVLDGDGSLRIAAQRRSGAALLCGSAELEAACRAAARHATIVQLGPGVEPATDAPLRPVLGSTEDGVLHLDIRETSRGGTGPHGMLIGVTGSGKSEVLRSVVAGLIAVHPPAELSLLLVDFKGGATFAPFENLAQTAAVITNLEDDPALLHRMRLALAAELRRRQQALRTAGVASIDDLPAGTAPPRLVVVVDEFSELLTAQPETLEVLVQIGRLGRSLGVHLLIAAQRLDEGRLKGLDSHLTYRIALRTQSVAESRAVIGTADAATLANAPGRGYLRRGSAAPIAFRARFTGAAAPRPTAPHPEAAHATTPRPAPPDAAGPYPPALLQYGNGPLLRPAPRASGPTILEGAIAAAAAMPGERLPIWVPPPTGAPTHEELYDDLTDRPDRGHGTLTGSPTAAAIGLADRPDAQRIDVATVDLGTGHLAVVGTTRSGTTTTAASALLSLALRNTPHELNLYLVEAASGGLGRLRPLPHTAAYADEPDRVRAVVRRVAAVVDQRERAADRTAWLPRIVLAVDGYARFRDSHEELDPVLLGIAQRGLAVGVHLVLTTHRWMDLRARLRELFGNRIELRLGDPIESEIDRRAAALVPRARPGRGLTQAGHPLYAAKPAADLVEQICRAWRGPRARGLAELPPVLTTRNLSEDLTGQGLCLAVERTLGRAVLLPEEPPFTLIIGDPGSGRTSVLRSLGLQDAARGARLLVLDPKRRLLGDLPEDRLLGYAATPAAAAELLGGLVAGLERRMPPPEITVQQLRERSWWRGPRLHLLVDDYDVVTMVGATLAPLRWFLPYAADIGLRVTIARRAAGAAAALHDETLSVLRDLGASALLLSRALDEGAVLGARPGPAAWGTGILTTPTRANLDVQAITEPPRDAPAPADGR